MQQSLLKCNRPSMQPGKEKQRCTEQEVLDSSINTSGAPKRSIPGEGLGVCLPFTRAVGFSRLADLYDLL